MKEVDKFIKDSFFKTRIVSDIVMIRKSNKRKGASNVIEFGNLKTTQEKVVFRRPMANSDARSKVDATHELRATWKASKVSAAPKLHDAWYVSRSNDTARRGLHMISAAYDFDLHDIIHGDKQFFSDHRKRIANLLEEKAFALSGAGILFLDVKDGNVVLNKEPLDVRFIDFGTPHCQMRSQPSNTLWKMVSGLEINDSDASKVMGIVMLIMLSASITSDIYSYRLSENTNAETRKHMNPLWDKMHEIRLNTPYTLIRIIKNVLRDQTVRETVCHYNGRRYSTTKRIFDISNFRI